jgi:hypothetical protein
VNPGLGSLLALIVAVAALVAAALAYFARIELPRPPIGTYESSDIAVMSVLVIVAPLAYLALPRSVVATVFGLVVFAAVQLTLAPKLGGRNAAAAAALLCGATATTWLLHGTGATEVLNDVTLTIAVIGVANLWVQSGMRASHITAFAAVLTVYDLTATSLTTVMSRFATEIQGIAFAPQVVLSTGRAPVGIGLGDLLMLLLFPLAATKAFGRMAGVVAAVAAVAVTALAALLLGLGEFGTDVPLLTLLGPVICAQYVFWRRAGYRERTVAQWRAGEPARTAEPDTLSALRAAWNLPIPEAHGETPGEVRGTWVAIDEGRIVGSGASMGLARKSARINGHEGVPIVKET